MAGKEFILFIFVFALFCLCYLAMFCHLKLSVLVISRSQTKIILGVTG